MEKTTAWMAQMKVSNSARSTSALKIGV